MPSDTDIIIALAKKLQTQNLTRLEAENATLRRERDDARAQGISDLNRIHRHSATIKRLEEERDRLRAGQGTRPDGKPNDDSGDRVPRVITADELREGQWVAASVNGGPWEATTIQVREESGGLFFMTSTRYVPSTDLKGVTIVLLEEAHTEPDKPEYQKFYDSIGATDLLHRTPPRLTVHALNTAPVGSNVSTPNKAWTKNSDGTWFRVTRFGQHERTSEELIALGYASATLTRPGQATA